MSLELSPESMSTAVTVTMMSSEVMSSSTETISEDGDRNGALSFSSEMLMFSVVLSETVTLSGPTSRVNINAWLSSKSRQHVVRYTEPLLV